MEVSTLKGQKADLEKDLKARANKLATAQAANATLKAENFHSKKQLK